MTASPNILYKRNIKVRKMRRLRGDSTRTSSAKMRDQQRRIDRQRRAGLR